MLDKDSRPAKFDYQPQSIAGKAIIVTGGTTGIGRATAVLLASQGARILTFGRHEPELQDALNDMKAFGGEVHGLVADVAHEADIQRVFAEADDRLGGVDILINNAGVSGGSITEGDYKEWDYVIRTNLLGLMACCREAIDRMKIAGGGHVVNVGTMGADVRSEGSDVYVATKSGVQGFSEALRKLVNKDNIKVTLIEPGKTGANLSGDGPALDQEQAAKAENCEMLKAEDIAQSIYFSLIQPARCDIVNMQVRPLLELI
jgi:NADP-dependent 3-hydroxy acid dehydrogenase YdfG